MHTFTNLCPRFYFVFCYLKHVSVYILQAFFWLVVQLINYSIHCILFVSLARATLVLIPLLGIHEVVFTVLIDECMEGDSRYARNFINLTLSSFQVQSIMLIMYLTKVCCCLFYIHIKLDLYVYPFFQGFLVAVLYCFANGEVCFLCQYSSVITVSFMYDHVGESESVSQEKCIL